MSRKSTMANSFNWSSQEWVEHFRKNGIGIDTLASISGSNEQERMISAAGVLTSRGYHTWTGQEVIAAANLGHLTGEGVTLRNLVKRGYRILEKRYSSSAEAASQAGIPNVHLLRLESGTNGSNMLNILGYEFDNGTLLKSGAALFPRVLASEEDWREGVYLPTDRDFLGEEAFDFARLMGNYWAAGALSKKDVSYQLPSREFVMCARGDSKQERLVKFTKPLMEKVHNFKVLVREQECTFKTNDGKTISAGGYNLKKRSSAFASWLTTVHNFPTPDNVHDQTIPRIPWTRETALGFIGGYSEFNGNFEKSTGGTPEVLIWGKGREFADEIARVLTKNKVTCSKVYENKRYGCDWKLFLRKETTEELQRRICAPITA